MLPASLLAFSAAHGCISPSFLTPRDEPWIARLLADVVAFGGRTVGEWEDTCESKWIPSANSRGATLRHARGVLHVLNKAWTPYVDAPVSPIDVRRTVFEFAVQSSDRRTAIDAAAQFYQLPFHVVESALFADRARNKRLRAPPFWAGPQELVERYNLSLVQGLLLHAHQVTVHVESHVRSVVRYAKLRRLLCIYELDSRGTVLHISGPLSILRHTTKYGHALASFLPAVTVTPGWSLEACCALGSRSGKLMLTSRDPLAAHHVLPKETDSAVETRLANDVRKLRSTWTIERETAALHFTGQDGKPRLFFPDFTLVRGNDRVLVEVVGFYTAEYLTSKLQALRALREHRILVCVDDSLGISSEVEAAGVLLYRRRIDAKELLRAAEILCS